MIQKKYQRKLGSLVWWKNDKIITGDELSRKMDEFEKINFKN
jgi:hypothetical protein